VDAEAPAAYGAGEHPLSTDEMTGIQALARAHKTPLRRPGQVERPEFEYIRQGPLTLMANFESASGQLIAPSLGPTRTEPDFVAHIAQSSALDPQAKWTVVTGQLNIHHSEGLLRFVADPCALPPALGLKVKSGILKSMPSRAAFLSDPAHRIRYTPKHSSWLNQIESWFSILIRRLLKRASFLSTDHLRQPILPFFDYFYATANPFK
jgi:hypothetical protein